MEVICVASLNAVRARFAQHRKLDGSLLSGSNGGVFYFFQGKNSILCGGGARGIVSYIALSLKLWLSDTVHKRGQSSSR